MISNIETLEVVREKRNSIEESLVKEDKIVNKYIFIAKTIRRCGFLIEIVFLSMVLILYLTDVVELPPLTKELGSMMLISIYIFMLLTILISGIFARKQRNRENECKLNIYNEKLELHQDYMVYFYNEIPKDAQDAIWYGVRIPYRNIETANYNAPVSAICLTGEFEKYDITDIEMFRNREGLMEKIKEITIYDYFQYGLKEILWRKRR